MFCVVDLCICLHPVCFWACVFLVCLCIKQSEVLAFKILSKGLSLSSYFL